MQNSPTINTRPSLAAWYVLAVLTGVTFLSYVDRHVLLLLAQTLKLHFSLSDLQLGLLQGTGIALFTAVASFPLGWLADRFDKRLVLAACIAVWSLAVAASGLSQDFAQLFIASGMVAFGEAGLAPIAYALIPLMFAGAKRQLANSIFAVTAVGGGALAMALAGMLIEWSEAAKPYLPASISGLENWRISFLIAALPAPFMILLVLSLRIPSRGMRITSAYADTTPTSAVVAGNGEMLGFFRRHWRALALMYSGVALGGMSFGAIGPWLAIISIRNYGQTPAQVGSALGMGQLVSAICGFILSLLIYRIFVSRFGRRLPIVGILAAYNIMLIGCFSLLLVNSATGLYVFYAVFGAFLSLTVMLQPTLLQSVMPLPFIGRAVALQFVFTMSLAAIPGPLVGALSDRLQFLPDGTVIAMVLVASSALLLATLLLWLCFRRYISATMQEVTAMSERL